MISVIARYMTVCVVMCSHFSELCSELCQGIVCVNCSVGSSWCVLLPEAITIRHCHSAPNSQKEASHGPTFTNSSELN